MVRIFRQLPEGQPHHHHHLHILPYALRLRRSRPTANTIAMPEDDAVTTAPTTTDVELEVPSSPVSTEYFDASEKLIQSTELAPNLLNQDPCTSCTADASSPSPNSPVNTDEDNKHLSLNDSLSIPNMASDTILEEPPESKPMTYADALKQLPVHLPASPAPLPDSPAKKSPIKKERTKTVTPPPPSPTFHLFEKLPWPLQARIIELATEASHPIQFCNYTHSSRRPKRIQAMNNTMAPYKTQVEFYKPGSRHYCRHNTFSFPHHVAASVIRFLGIVGKPNWQNLRSIAFPIDSVTIWAICMELLRGLQEVTFVVDCRERYNFDMRFFHRIRLLCDASPLITNCVLGLADPTTWPAYDENYKPQTSEVEQMPVSTLQDFFGAWNRWLEARNDPLVGEMEQKDMYLAACAVMFEKVRLGESVYHTRISKESKDWFKSIEPKEGFKFLDIHHNLERKLDVYIPHQPNWGVVKEEEEEKKNKEAREVVEAKVDELKRKEKEEAEDSDTSLNQVDARAGPVVLKIRLKNAEAAREEGVTDTGIVRTESGSLFLDDPGDQAINGSVKPAIEERLSQLHISEQSSAGADGSEDLLIFSAEERSSKELASAG